MPCRVCRIGDTDFWAARLFLPPGDTEVGPGTSSTTNSPVALHFVLDNSGSMGSMTTEIKEIFSELVDNAASAPCSLTLFSEKANLLSDRIMSSKQMLNLPRVKQGLTNIPEGVRKAMDVITTTEVSEICESVVKKTHHVLILLTDGLHNRGLTPSKEFPTIGEEARKNIPDVQLSVVVVGITKDSSTSMGMLLKTNIETVPLDASLVDNVYFASSRSSMRSVMAKLIDGLGCLSTGSVRSIRCPGRGHIVAEIGRKESKTSSIRTNANDSSLEFLIAGEGPPQQLTLDGSSINITEDCESDHELIANILAKQIDRLRVKRVASSGSSSVQAAMKQLTALIDALDEDLKTKGRTKLALRKACSADRLTQHRNVIKTVHMARELRNQLADVANFSASCSQAQAAFLTGGQSKYASRAMRRAAARSGNDGLLDPQKEMARVQSEVGNASFAEELDRLLMSDAMNHLKKLSVKQTQELKEHVQARSASDFEKLGKVLVMLDSILSFDSANKDTAAEMGGKAHTSALCWIPPTGDIYEHIQGIRERYDKQIKRWPPHVNLLYPFVPANEFEDAVKKLAPFLQPIRSFCVNFTEIRHFTHGKKSHTAWLNPEETSEFVDLQATCQAAFPHCNDLGKRGSFVPHLTVGQCTSSSSVEALKMSAAWEPSATSCGEICLISREGQDKPFEVHWRVELGTGRCVATAASGKARHPSAIEKKDRRLSTIDPGVKQFVDSGALAGHLNDVFFGERRSYLSLMNPWEHIAEWKQFGNAEQGFKSQWEMLLYAGYAAYPILVERSAGTQMNPFQLAIKKVHTSMVDTASLCCANHSEIDTFGPEGGEPIVDALVLVDPSCPKASAKVASSTLGETFTSTVLSRDLHMYTGATMKAALHAHSLFRCLQPDSNDSKTSSDVAAEIRREFLGRAYQCGSCGFGPVDHGGCRDLFAHHGENDGNGGVASNACPSCGWFSDYLGDWDEWDGTIPPAMLHERLGKGRGKCDNGGNGQKLLEAKAGMVLRILYSFRKTFGGCANPVRAWYNDLAQRLVDWDLRLTTQDDVDGLVQVLIAAAACDDEVLGDVKAIEAAFAPPALLAIVNEACARAARKKFRMAAGGDNGKADGLAAERVTDMLGITRDSAPNTTGSLLEPEPSRENVERHCCRDYSIDPNAGQPEAEWAEKVVARWCTALDFVKALRMSIARRGGGWERLEQDMETSLSDYADVVGSLTGVTVRPYAEACDIDKATTDRTLVTMAAQAFLNGRGADRGMDLPDVRDEETLCDIARDMRMRIYSDRVREKMAQWKCEGERMVFLKARVSDIGTYEGMVNAQRHAHGLSKEDFWGLWEAAVCDESAGGEKVRAFLETANETFRYKYAPEGGKVHSVRGRKKSKKHSKRK